MKKNSIHSQNSKKKNKQTFFPTDLSNIYALVVALGAFANTFV